jgi:serpin B
MNPLNQISSIDRSVSISPDPKKDAGIFGTVREAIQSFAAAVGHLIFHHEVQPVPPDHPADESFIQFGSMEKYHAAQARRLIANFANDLCARIVKEHPDQSFAVSPLSILAALGMCLHLIKPEKKEQFLRAIGFGQIGNISEALADTVISEALRNMALPKDFDKGTMTTAQGIALQNGCCLDPSFIEFVKKTYGAEFIQADDLVDPVNQWVSQKTHEKIPTILSDHDAALCLLNAIYLNFKWKDPFERPAEGWKTEDFLCANGKTAPVSMMRQTADLPVYHGATFDMLEKPYLSPDGRTLSQLIFLPHDPFHCSEMESALTEEMILKCRFEARVERVDLKMPKIKMESEFHLLQMLKAMGLPLDDLDGRIAPDLFIDDVIHKTFVSSDEIGTEAAAVTAIVCLKCCIEPTPTPFHVRHSYAYLIMDGDKVLFRGKVADPKPLVVDKK